VTKKSTRKRKPLKFCHKEVGRKTAVGLACFRRGGRGKEKTGGRRALEFKEYKSL
jgi:hypothetical protein